MQRAAMLYGNGEGRTTVDLEVRMCAPDLELLEFAWPYLQRQHDDRMAGAVNRGFVGDK